MKANYIVTSEVHGDVAAFVNPEQAYAYAGDLNRTLFDQIVYFPLIEANFSVAIPREMELNRQYNEQQYFIVNHAE